MVRIGRKNPSELSAMKKIPATYTAASPLSEPEPRHVKPMKADPSPAETVEQQKRVKGKHEPLKAQDTHDSVRVQHFVEQALSRYETKRQ